MFHASGSKSVNNYFRCEDEFFKYQNLKLWSCSETWFLMNFNCWLDFKLDVNPIKHVPIEGISKTCIM